jgi:hypothetical protein
MADLVHCLAAAGPGRLAGEVFGLAALCATILAVLSLPVLA